jgi:peptidoglycan/xylan/chitin deacetylase (PgdA/CDA1 family)
MSPAVRALIGDCFFGLGLDAALLADAAVVVAFHRVQPLTDPSDSLTTSVEMFERHCRFFQRHFHVAPLRDLVRRLENGERMSGQIAITFDDGYLDNFEYAAPVLEALGLPATFFVVSDWIDSAVVPWWDEVKGARYPWMTWNDVRTLHRKGFEIGAHTRTHVNLGEVSGETAQQEIIGSRERLERELSATVESLAYPYGRRGNMTEANRTLVKAAGFRCCCSAYGGVNRRGTDPFCIERVPISPWYASPSQLGLEVALGRSYLSE